MPTAQIRQAPDYDALFVSGRNIRKDQRAESTGTYKSRYKRVHSHPIRRPHPVLLARIPVSHFGENRKAPPLLLSAPASRHSSLRPGTGIVTTADTPETARAEPARGKAMRSQLNASFSPPPSLRRALPAATPRALRYGERTASIGSAFLLRRATEAGRLLNTALPGSRFHAFPWRFRAPQHHGRGAGARCATNLPAPGSHGTVNGCSATAWFVCFCQFTPSAPLYII